jgi:hypothetical protein
VTGSYAQDIDRFKIKMKQGFENLEYCPTGDQIADIFTKAIKRAQFMKLKELASLN